MPPSAGWPAAEAVLEEEEEEEEEACTRIIYDRKFLLDRRNSPMAQTPPCHLPDIPGVTSPGAAADEPKAEAGSSLSNHDGKPSAGDDAQFEMDI
ncbi:Eukaryotic translation initiation factor 4E-binding protein 2 [Aix galericulata]|nr:Eukaryotic translation initiation factor 4E-binding protein 2 [Aix galericulata]